MYLRRSSAVLAVSLALLVSACGDGSDEADPASAEETSVAADLLDFRTLTVGGEEFDASTLAGRDVVVWFWSPWCSSCAREADGVGRVAGEFGDDVAFIGIAGDAELDEHVAFLDDHDLSTFPQLVDDSGEIWLRFGADVIRSSFFFLDDTGETSQSGYGEIDEADLRERVEALLTS